MMTVGDAPVRKPRYHQALLTAFLRGATVEEACVEARVSRSTAQRWRNQHGDELEARHLALVEEAVRELRAGLVSAARRLRAEAEDRTNAGTGVRAAVALLTAYQTIAVQHELEQRVAALEQARLT